MDKNREMVPDKKKEFQTHKKRLKSTLFIMTKYNM